MSISKQMREYIQGGSLIRRLFDDATRMQRDGSGQMVCDFTLGNPTLPPPPQFNEALARYVANTPEGAHRYMPNAGLWGTRQAIAQSLFTDHGLIFDASHILMTVGAAGAVNVILKAVLDPGDEVLVSAPYFVEYGYYATNHRGQLVTVPAMPDFNLDVDALAAAITERTRVVLITNPNNPTGVMYPQETLNRLGQALRDASKKQGRPIYLVDDAPYRKLVYDVPRCTSAFMAYENTIMITSHSKDLSLPGERIGYLALSPQISQCDTLQAACAFANRILGFVNAPALMQHMAASLQDVTIDLDWYRVRRDRLYSALTAMGYDMPYPDGAFYLFVKAPRSARSEGDDVAFVEELKKHRVLTVPGSGFGFPGYFRIAYCVSELTIETSLDVFAEVVKK